jgi:hypothetical protein
MRMSTSAEGKAAGQTRARFWHSTGLTRTSLFSIDAPKDGIFDIGSPDGPLQDSYLPAIGDIWSTQQLPQ